MGEFLREGYLVYPPMVESEFLDSITTWSNDGLTFIYYKGENPTVEVGTKIIDKGTSLGRDYRVFDADNGEMSYLKLYEKGKYMPQFASNQDFRYFWVPIEGSHSGNEPLQFEYLYKKAQEDNFYAFFFLEYNNPRYSMIDKFASEVVIDYQGFTRTRTTKQLRNTRRYLNGLYLYEQIDTQRYYLIK